MSSPSDPRGAAAFAALQRLLPQHLLSRQIGRLARSEKPWIRKPFIRGFAAAYDVDLSEAQRNDPDDYRSFNDFFTRALRPEARPLDPAPNAVLCPSDGMLSQFGEIRQRQLLQAKGTTYSLDVLAGAPCREFEGGSFATVYLAPRDYHRVHLPVTGTLVETTTLPGALFSVNARTEAAVTDLFCRNERLACRFETPHGAMLVVLVGALIVASIDTVWPGPTSPYQSVVRTPYDLTLDRGDEIGRFLLGSTVILCFEPGRVRWRSDLSPHTRVRMGQTLGDLLG
jgi:phosphatidylserine decarboxylase